MFCPIFHLALSTHSPGAAATRAPSIADLIQKSIENKTENTHCKTVRCSHKERLLYALLIETPFARLNINGESSEEENFLNDQRNRKVIQ